MHELQKDITPQFARESICQMRRNSGIKTVIVTTKNKIVTTSLIILKIYSLHWRTSIVQSIHNY